MPAHKDRRIFISYAHRDGMPIATFTYDVITYCCAFVNDHKIIAGDAGGRVHFLFLEKSNRKSY